MKITDEEKPRHQKGIFKTKYINNITIVYFNRKLGKITQM